MAGLTHVLNTAKQALLTQQRSIQVTGHNVANVDTPGYSRQTHNIRANHAVQMGNALLGGGVSPDTITRSYDQFMVERITRQSSLMGNLQAQQQSLRVVEPIFNEARGLAMNDLLNQFWNSWQELSDNPESLAARQNVLQNGHLLSDHFKTMNDEIIRARSDIGTNIDTAVGDINSLTSQIAALNSRITSAEVAKAEANDLRDQRDNLVKELAGLVEISHFASKNGTYTVLMANGHPLVEGDEAWQVSWSDNQLNWVSTDGSGKKVSRPLTGAQLGGKMGGWLEIHSELAPGNPNNYAGRLDALANALIRELNQVHSTGSGTVKFADQLVGGDIGRPTSVTTGTVATGTASRNIAAGAIQINGLDIGAINGAFPVHGLATTKAANTVEAINQADTGVSARLTTQANGVAITEADLNAVSAGDSFSFTVNGEEITVTLSNVDGFQDPDDDDNEIEFNVNGRDNISFSIGDLEEGENVHTKFLEELTKEISKVLEDHNIEAAVGDGSNGAATNALLFRNTNAGDESSITIDNLIFTPDDEDNPAGLSASMLGLDALAGETIVADADHNTGQVTLFSDQRYTIKAGVDDTILAQLGLHDKSDDGITGNGRIAVTPDPLEDKVLLTGFKYGDELNTEDGSFEIWLYSADGSLALPEPVTVSLERAYSANDAAQAINQAILAAGGTSDGETPWVKASFDRQSGRFKLDPVAGHQFAFGADSSNFLQVAGLNTFFTGHSAGTIGVNRVIADNLDYMAAGKVGENGEIFPGDNRNALELSNLQHKDDIHFLGGRVSSLNGFYNSLVGDIGNKGRTIDRNVEFNTLVLNQMNEMRDTVSGVSLDEEMANLIKFQHAYTAAARLISTSDEMLVTLLDTVR
ncbi:flagellar hook-associated protein FlgK [Desulfurivibrio alkaliphilus]|uniref:Flagellar hook-associated protein 1 n=1 Tax=Desulfurivibrio alkaliphilus (strain DSM 19089 / UNIQEM U267 / AHT2) TaxID=589865 RepID=D6Z723_DESAT|nr:flagellar hook-associated protein FlgK [Desulfurivibrio alkaliphilus]ADH87010.1 flagellar hook-associated protein FlgK [Desulfurivibrio alkaliphilus AHT 2]